MGIGSGRAVYIMSCIIANKCQHYSSVLTVCMLRIVCTCVFVYACLFRLYIVLNLDVVVVHVLLDCTSDCSVLPSATPSNQILQTITILEFSASPLIQFFFISQAISRPCRRRLGLPPYAAWRSPTAHDPLPHQAKYTTGATMRLRTQGLALPFGRPGQCDVQPGAGVARDSGAQGSAQPSRRLSLLCLCHQRERSCRSSRPSGLNLNSGPENAWREIIG